MRRILVLAVLALGASAAQADVMGMASSKGYLFGLAQNCGLAPERAASFNTRFLGKLLEVAAADQHDAVRSTWASSIQRGQAQPFASANARTMECERALVMFNRLDSRLR